MSRPAFDIGQAALGADQQGHVTRRRWRRAETVVGAWIQQQPDIGRRRLERVLQRRRRGNVRDPNAPTLLAGADRDLLPVYDLPARPCGVEPHDASFAFVWANRRDAQFCGFLNQQVHALFAADSLKQRHAQCRFGSGVAAGFDCQRYSLARDRFDPRVELEALAVEHDDRITLSQPQNLADVRDRVAGELDLRVRPQPHVAEYSWCHRGIIELRAAMTYFGYRSGVFRVNAESGLVDGVRHVSSPNFDDRPPDCQPELIIVHGISLPPGEFGGPWIDKLFTNSLDPGAHPYFGEIADARVSTHLLIERSGDVVQYVPVNKRAWHAGESCFCERERCNDFSIGIELEGTDTLAYADAQYESLCNVVHALRTAFASLADAPIVGHSDVAPGRKTDPGPAFDWDRFRRQLTAGEVRT